MRKILQTIPVQQSGKKSDIIERITARKGDNAMIMYHTACDRLLNINGWKEISQGLSAEFCLIDPEGNKKASLPGVGDYIRIDIPGLGPAAGGGYDWVKIELIEREESPETGFYALAVRVRPAADPLMQKGTAHFFNEHATSSFIIQCQNRVISATIHGRNEKPNVQVGSFLEKFRNFFTGTGAKAAISEIQWTNLLKGILTLRPSSTSTIN